MSIVARLKYWLFQPVDRIALQVPRALVASVLCALLDCAYMVFLVEVCHWQPVSAAILSYLVGGVLQYILCSVWVFSAVPDNKAVGFLTFTLLSLGGLGITWVVMAAGGIFLLPYALSKFLALGFAFVWNFTSRKYLLFGQKAGANNAERNREKPKVPKDYREWIATMAKATTARSRKTPDDLGTDLVIGAALNEKKARRSPQTQPMLDLGS